MDGILLPITSPGNYDIHVVNLAAYTLLRQRVAILSYNLVGNNTMTVTQRRPINVSMLKHMHL